MSGLQQIGVQAIFDVGQFVKGVQTYIAQLNRAALSTAQVVAGLNALGASSTANAQRIIQLGATIAALRSIMQNQAAQNAQLAAQLNALGLGLRNAGAAAGQAGQAVRNAGQQAARSSTDWGGLTSRVLILGGVFSHFASRILGDLSEKFNEAAGFVVGVVADYERLGFAIEALTRRERGQIQASESLRDGLSELSISASELLPWITRLAIESPFNEADVAQAFKVALVYNFLSSEAQTLVTVLTDFAAATGKTGDDLERVALALGQMRSAGRVLGTELRQLSEAGINVNQILDQMGFTLKDVRDGAVGANDFIRTLVRTLAVDFEGAAKRQTDTLAGLASKLQDVLTIGARNLFGPMLKAIQPDLITFVNTLQSFLPVVKDIGLALGYLTNQLFKVSYGAERGEIAISGFSEGGKSLIKVLASIGASIATFIVSIGAIGILIGLIGALTNPILGVIALIGGLAAALAGAAGAIVFFWEDLVGQVNSTLDSWGTDMYEYGYNLIYQFAAGMAGAIGAILDVLTNIARYISSWLSPGSPPKILPNIDQWGTATINEWLRGWLKGDFSLLEGIADPIEGFLRSLVGLGIDEIDVVPLIIRMRTAITSAVDEFVQLGSVSEETFRRIFNKLGATDPVLQAYVRSMVSLEIADKKVAAAQEELNAITERYNELLRPIDDELRAIEDERQRFINNTRRADLQAILQDPFAPAEAKRLAALELREIALKEQRAQIVNNQAAEEEAAKEKLRLAQEERALVLEQMEAQKAQIALMTENNRLLQEQMRLLERLARQRAGGGDPEPTPPPFEPIDFGLGGGGAVPLPFTGLIDDLKKKIDELLLLFAPLTSKWNEFKQAAGDALGAAATWVSAFLTSIQEGDYYGAGKQLGETLTSGVLDALGVPTISFKWSWEPVPKTAGGTFVDGFLQGIKDGFVNSEIGKAIITWWQIFIYDLTTSTEWTRSGNGVIEGFIRGIGQGLLDLAGTIETHITTFVNQWKTALGIQSPSTVFAAIGADLVAGLWSGISTAWTTFWTNITTNLEAFKTEVSTKFTEAKDSAIDLFSGETGLTTIIMSKANQLVTDILTPLNTTRDQITTAFTEAATNVGTQATAMKDRVTEVPGAIATWITENWLTIVEVGKNMGRAIEQGFRNIVQPLVDIVNAAVEAIRNALGEHSPSTVFMDIAKNMMLGMVVGIQQTGDLVGDALVRSITSAYRRVMEISPPSIDPPIFSGTPPLSGPPYNTNPPIPFPNQLLKFVNGRLVSPLLAAYGQNGQIDPAEFMPRHHPGPIGPPVSGGPEPMPFPIYNTQRKHPGPIGPPAQVGGLTGPLAQFGDTYISSGMDEAIFKARMKRTISNSIRGLR